MTTKRTLQLTLERQYFDRIATGVKTQEFRERKEYWATRLEGRDYDTIIFRNGYGPKVPEMEVEFKGVKKITRNGDALYAIQLGNVLSIKRWNGPAKN